MLSISCYFTTETNLTPNAVQIANAFGLAPDQQRRARFVICDDLNIELKPGQILFITGQSGSGKTTIFNILKTHLKPACELERIRVKPTKILPENFNLPLKESLYYLSLAGLADAHLFLRKPNELSDGQRYRFKLALALARGKKADYIFADNFLDPLDRITAKIIARNVRKFAEKFNKAFVVASPNFDFFDQLAPDILIEKGFSQTNARIQHFHRH